MRSDLIIYLSYAEGRKLDGGGVGVVLIWF